MKIGAGTSLAEAIPHGQEMKVKFEIDTNPPLSFETESRYILEPLPFGVRVYSPGDLFAGKMHVILFRAWKNRVKGRDWYDLIFFIKNKTPLHLEHLASRIRQTGQLAEGESLTQKEFEEMLTARIGSVDYTKAKEDVLPFIKDISILQLWSADFFRDIVKGIQYI